MAVLTDGVRVLTLSADGIRALVAWAYGEAPPTAESDAVLEMLAASVEPVPE